MRICFVPARSCTERAESMEIPSPLTMDCLILSRSFILAITLRSEGAIPDFSRKKSISFCAGAFFTDYHRFPYQLLQSGVPLFQLKIVRRYRGGDQKRILTEGDITAVVLFNILADQAKIYASVNYLLDSLRAVRLERMKVYVRTDFSKACQKLRKQIRRGNGRGTEINNVFF